MSILERARDSRKVSTAALAHDGDKWASKNNKTLILDVISFIARFYMAYIWISAGWSKMNDHMQVTQTIMAYEIFTPQWSDLLARLIGPLELAGGLLLLFGLFMKQANKVAIVVLTLFIIGVGQAWSRGLVIDCGCFSPADVGGDAVRDYVVTIVRDVLFIGLHLWAIYRPFKRWAIYPG